MQRLTARARLFAERTQDTNYRTHVDAYLSVYRTNSSRRNATVNAARIYKNKEERKDLCPVICFVNAARIYKNPLLKAYLQELHARRIAHAREEYKDLCPALLLAEKASRTRARNIKLD